MPDTKHDLVIISQIFDIPNKDLLALLDEPAPRRHIHTPELAQLASKLQLPDLVFDIGQLQGANRQQSILFQHSLKRKYKGVQIPEPIQLDINCNNESILTTPIGLPGSTNSLTESDPISQKKVSQLLDLTSQTWLRKEVSPQTESKPIRLGFVSWFNGEYGVIKSRFGEAFVHKNNNPSVHLTEGDIVQYDEQLDPKKNRNNAKKCRAITSLDNYVDQRECAAFLSHVFFDHFSSIPPSLKRTLISSRTLETLIQYRLSMSFLPGNQQVSPAIDISQWNDLVQAIATSILNAQNVTDALQPIVTLLRTFQQRMPHWFSDTVTRQHLHEQCFWYPLHYCSGKLSADLFLHHVIIIHKSLNSLWSEQTIPVWFLQELQTNLEQWSATVQLVDEAHEMQSRERTQVIAALLQTDPSPFEDLFQYTSAYSWNRWVSHPEKFDFPQPKTPDEVVRLLEYVPDELLTDVFANLSVDQVSAAYPQLTTTDLQIHVVNWLFWRQVQSLGVVAFDIETKPSGAIREVCFTHGDSFEVYSSITQKNLPICISALQTSIDSGKLLVGHNIREFDIPILTKQGADFGQLSIWDTLEIEALLSPLARSYALVTAHNAKSDTEKAVALFHNQLQRILMRWSEIVHLIKPIVSGEVYKWLQNFVAKFQKGLEFPANETRHRFFHADIIGSPINFPKLSFKEPTLLVTPRIMWSQFIRLPGVEFVSVFKHNLELEDDITEGPDPFTTRFDAGMIEAIIKDQYLQNVLVAYIVACHATRIAPTIVNLPVWTRLRLQTKLTDIGIICKASTLLPDQADPTIFYIADDISALQLSPTQAVPWQVQYINPTLSAITFKHKLGLIRLQDNTDIFNQPSLWTRMVGGNRFAPVPRQWLSDMPGIEEPYPQLNNFWLEKKTLTDFIIWGNLAHPEIYKELTHARDDESVKPNSIDTCPLTLIHTKEQAGLFYRLNSETPYRDVYWTGQFYLLQQLAVQQPIVWLIHHRYEMKPLQAMLEAMGYWCPPAEHSLVRQLEMIHQSNHKNRVLLATLHQLPAIAQINYWGPLTLIIDNLPLTEVAMMVPQSVEAQPEPSTDEKIETEPTDENGDDEETDSGDEGQPTPAEKQKVQRVNPEVSFQLITPVIQYYRQLIHQNNSANQLILIEPRLVDQIGLAKQWNAEKQNISLWESESEYKALYEQVAKYIPSPKKVSFDFTDLAKIQQTIERVFLGQNKQGEWLALRENQQPYFDSIIQPTDDLIVSLPTGGGKSVLFQGPALYRGSLSNRLTVVITPLRALMEDQVSNLEELGFFGCVEFINQQSDNIQDIYRRIAGGEITLVYVTPERFRSRNFDRALKMRMQRDHGLEYCVFDEAHCISQWGSEFRPDYLWVATLINRIKKANGNFPALFFSATISEQIYNDLIEIFQ